MEFEQTEIYEKRLTSMGKEEEEMCSIREFQTIFHQPYTFWDMYIKHFVCVCVSVCARARVCLTVFHVKPINYFHRANNETVNNNIVFCRARCNVYFILYQQYAGNTNIWLFTH